MISELVLDSSGWVICLSLKHVKSNCRSLGRVRAVGQTRASVAADREVGERSHRHHLSVVVEMSPHETPPT